MRCTIEMNKPPKISVGTNEANHVYSISRQQMWITSKTTLNFLLLFFSLWRCVGLGGGSYLLVFYTKSNSDRCYNLFWLFVSFTARTNNCVLSDFNLWNLKIESTSKIHKHHHQTHFRSSLWLSWLFELIFHL